jgi:glycosyltransferase involved in cell wall biosynthesis
MHIAFWSPALPGDERANGIVTYVDVMLRALEQAGHRVSVLSKAGIRLPSGDVIRVGGEVSLSERIRRRIPGDNLSKSGARTIERRFRLAQQHGRIDLLEIEESFGWGGHLVGRLGCPVVLRLHGPHFAGRNQIETAEARTLGDLRESWEAEAIARADAVTSPSQRLLAATLAYHSVNPAIALTIPNPIEAAPLEGRWSAARADSKHLLCVGRFDLRKGADIVLRAFARAADQDPDIRLTMVGPDVGLARENAPPVHFAQFVAEEIPAEIRPRITFKGKLPRAEVAELRREAGVTIVGSRFENFAYSVAEAMAMGAPLIVSDSFGNGEMVDDGVTGLVVPIGDVERTAQAILRMANNPDEAAAMGARSHTKCLSWLEPARVAAETVALYERLT